MAELEAGDEYGGVCVRYACKCGHLAPVRSLFFSETCQKPVCRLPCCSVEEFESYYCGSLLVNLPSKEASMYQNRSSRCFSCPTCQSVLSTVFHDDQQSYFFLCPHCRWDSLALGLADDDPDALIMTAISRERQSAHEDVFQALNSHYSTNFSTSKSAVDGPGAFAAASSTYSGANSLRSLADSMKELQREHQMKKFRLQRMTEMGGWKYDQALAKVQEREQWLLDQRREHQWPELAAQLAAQPSEDTSFNIDSPAPTREALLKLAQTSSVGEVSTLQQRLLNPLDQPRDAERLFPSRPLLRVKRTWRCVESIERGSPGILVKPQISPMSGDSSLPVSSAWFKKANMAVHYLPVVMFQRLPYRVENAEGLECVLLVENPLDDAVRITFRADPATVETALETAENGQAVIKDLTPIIVGPYEDPNLADAFMDEESLSDIDGEARNSMVIQATRNLIKIKMPLAFRSSSASLASISARFIMDTEKYDEELNEVVEGSLLSVPVVLTAPITQ